MVTPCLPVPEPEHTRTGTSSGGGWSIVVRYGIITVLVPHPDGKTIGDILENVKI